MTNIPDEAVPYIALDDGVDLDGVYETSASLDDSFAPGADEDGGSDD